MTGPVIIVPPPRQRECIVVDGRRYCRDEKLSGKEGGVGLLLFVLLCLWLGYPMARNWAGTRPGWHIALYYAGPPTALALLLIIFGSW